MLLHNVRFPMFRKIQPMLSIQAFFSENVLRLALRLLFPGLVNVLTQHCNQLQSYALHASALLALTII